LALITLLLALGGLPAAAVHAQGCSFPITVGTAAQLNAAITCYNGQTTPDEYRITLSGDIALTASTPAITNATGGVSLRLDGAGHTVDGQGTAGVRPFEIGSAHVTIEHITITGGHAPFPLGVGGGIFNQGTLTIRHSTLSGNRATSGGGIYNQRGILTVSHSTLSGNQSTPSIQGGGGGGIYNDFRSVLVVLHSTFSNNHADNDVATFEDGGGGAIYNQAGAYDPPVPEARFLFVGMKVLNSTFLNNSAAFYGGAILNRGINDIPSGIPATAVISQSTLSGNHSDILFGVNGGGSIFNAFLDTLGLFNTIIANSPAGGDCVGAVTASRGNLIADSAHACGMSHGVNGNLIGVDPLLDPDGLQDNGGARPTIALREGSPALDAGDNATILAAGTVTCLDDFSNGTWIHCAGHAVAVTAAITTDQRGAGFVRLSNGRVDIGAYETQRPCPAFPTTVQSENALNQAIVCYNGHATPGAYLLTLSGDIALTASTLPIDNATPDVRLHLNGAGYTVDGQGILGVLPFTIAANTVVAMEGLTITGGNREAGPTRNDMKGGGIRNGGALTITHSTLSANHAQGGAGLFNEAGGVLTVTHSTLSANRSRGDFNGSTHNGAGGGIFNGGVLTVTHSTLSANLASFGGGIGNTSTATVTHSTLSGNRGSGGGGGIYNGIFFLNDFPSAAALTLTHTIVAASTRGGECVNAGTLTVGGVNLVQDGSCDPTALTGDPLLDPAGLQENGGPTPTIALCTGVDAPTVGCPGVSPALDGIPVEECTDAEGTPVLTDQRDGARPQGAACDLGAYEPETASGTTHCSTLGDAPPPARLDQDVFRVTGTSGETVTLTLAADPAGTQTSERATLLLTDQIAGVTFMRRDSSALPNTLQATLPATGTYLVTVVEHLNWPRGSAFGGAYCVTLESSGEAWEHFAPTVWVEGLFD
jgi:hypothetical protein